MNWVIDRVICVKILQLILPKTLQQLTLTLQLLKTRQSPKTLLQEMLSYYRYVLLQYIQMAVKYVSIILMTKDLVNIE